MTLNTKKRIGDLIHLVDERNDGEKVSLLLGVTVEKKFIPSVANTIGTDMSNYKIIRKGQFACSLMQVRRDKKIPVALLKEYDEAIVTSAYPVFEVNNEDEILPEYLMMWFCRKEFDRESCFYAVGGVRGSLEWEDFCNMKLPVPSLQEQQKLVDEYNVIQNRIDLNNKMIQKLEGIAQAIYKQRFVNFEFPNEQGNPYKSSGGKMVYYKKTDKEIPEGWEYRTLNDNPLAYVISTGISKFNGEKIYLATGEVNGTEINYDAKKVTYFCRESRANMQPSENSIRFAKMKNSKKFISLGNYSKDITDNYIFSTGFCGLQCSSKNYLEYLNCFINNNKFEDLKDTLAGGTTQEAINSDALNEFDILIPDNIILEKFNLLTYNIFKQIYIIQRERGALYNLHDLLLSKLYSYNVH